MKKILFLVALISLMSFNFAKAQNSLIATLSHDDDVKVFYGSDALIQAHEAATSGDVITLSSGTFKAADIKKAITLRGAGMALDSLNNMNHTIITGRFTCTISDTTNNLKMEGIYHNGIIFLNVRNAQFTKCRFGEINANNTIIDCTFLHCRIAQTLDGFNRSCYGNMFFNCIIEDFYMGVPSYSVNIFQNCVLLCARTSGSPGTMGIPTLYNCIIGTTGTQYTSFKEGTMAYNCIAVESSSNSVFSKVPSKTNQSVSSASEIFQTYNLTASIAENDDETFELADDAKTKYLGLDGTEVGIYGGTFPYSTILETPKIKKCNVAAKSTADGKLSVDIEVAVD